MQSLHGHTGDSTACASEGVSLWPQGDKAGLVLA